jgi:hypothetical protein
MENALTTEVAREVKPEEIYALREIRQVEAAIAANVPAGEGYDLNSLIQIKTPSGGAMQWQWNNATGPQRADTITGVIIYIGRRGTLWPSEQRGEAKSRPVLVTYDMITAHKVGDDLGDLDEELLNDSKRGDGSYDWVGTDEGGTQFYNSWGSSSKGRGKRCIETRVVGLLMEDERLPALLTLGKGSIFQKDGYPDGFKTWLAQLKPPAYQALTEFSLIAVPAPAEGTFYSRVVARHVGTLPFDAGQKLKELYEDGVRLAVEGGPVSSE